jgi:hypothetical protein
VGPDETEFLDCTCFGWVSFGEAEEYRQQVLKLFKQQDKWVITDSSVTFDNSFWTTRWSIELV